MSAASKSVSENNLNFELKSGQKFWTFYVWFQRCIVVVWMMRKTSTRKLSIIVERKRNEILLVTEVSEDNCKCVIINRVKSCTVSRSVDMMEKSISLTQWVKLHNQTTTSHVDITCLQNLEITSVCDHSSKTKTNRIQLNSNLN